MNNKKHNKKKLINLSIYCSLILLGLYMSVFQRSLEDISSFLKIVGLYSGLLVTAHFAGIFLVPLIAGELADKYGRRVVSCIAYTLFCSGLVICVITRNIYLFAAAVFLIGSGSGVIEGLMTTLLVDINRGEEARVINLSQAFFCIGALAGPLLTSVIISIGYSWRSMYVVFAIISMFYIIYFYKAPVVNRKVSAEKIKGTIVFRLLKQPVFVIIAISIFFYVGIEQGIGFWITSFVNTLGESVLAPSIVLSSFWGFMVAGRMLLGLRKSRYNIVNMILVFSLFSFLSIVLIVFSQGYMLTTIAFSLLGLGFSTIWPLIMSQAGQHSGKCTGTAFGIMMASSALGGMLIPFAAGVVRDFFSIRTAIGFMGLPLIIIIVFQFLIRKLVSRNKSVVNVMSYNSTSE